MRTNGAALIELNKLILERNESLKAILARIKDGVAAGEEIEQAITLAEENGASILKAIEYSL